MQSWRNPGAHVLVTVFCSVAGLAGHAQTFAVTQPSALVASNIALPDAPSQQVADQKPNASVSGTVTDVSGDTVSGALVLLERNDTHAQRTMTTDESGDFHFDRLEAGSFTLTIKSAGFAPLVVNNVALLTGQTYELPQVSLQVATTVTDVNVVFSRYDLAQEQLKAEEGQRVFAIVPNFYVTYNWNAAPLTSGQKFKLALRTTVDPVTFLGVGVIAGVQQWQNTYSGYGQGAAGYGKRYGAAYGDGFVSTMIGNAILPSVFHQDPRYFYKGTGSIRSRALYAIATVVICRGDNGHWQPNYSNVLGNFASAGISNAYYPASDRNGARLTIDNALIGTASGAFASLMQEFVVRHITHGIKQ